MFMLVASALALDCSGLDPALCAAVEQMTLDVNALTGTATIAEVAPVRLRPVTLYDELEDLQLTVEAQGCSVERYASGIYASGATEGTWRTLDATGSGTFETTYVPADRTFSGLFEGDASGPIGNGFGRYNRNRQHVGNWQGDFTAGRFVRASGETGVVISLQGGCLDVVTRSVDPWWSGSLEDLTPLRVFATSRYVAITDPRPWTGIAALDQRCQDEADAVFGVGLTTFRAGVVDLAVGLDHPADRFEAGRPLVRSVEGSYLEADVDALFDFTVSRVAVPVNTEADGTSFPLPDPEDNDDNEDVLWWGDYGPTAGLTSLNAPGEGDCEGWTNPGAPGFAIGGIPFVGNLRTHRFGASCGDGFQGRSYCVEVD